MLTPLDTPTAEDVLRLHQWRSAPHGVCVCGLVVSVTQRPAHAVMAEHQLAMLQASDLAVVSVHGTAAVVRQAAVVVGLLKPKCDPGAVHDAILLLRQRLENLAK